MDEPVSGKASLEESYMARACHFPLGSMPLLGGIKSPSASETELCFRAPKIEELL